MTTNETISQIATLTAERDRDNRLLNAATARLAEYAKDIAELTAERDAWRDTAAQHYDNQLFYHGLVVKIGEMFGDAAKIADDGSIMEDVLALKVPLLVASALSGLSASRAQEEELREALVALTKLNDDSGPFGGELQVDRIEHAWGLARSALAPKGEA